MSKPDPEVKPKQTRKYFTAKRKLEILKRTENCSKEELAIILRQEGIYYSYIQRWRSEYEKGVLNALTDNKRGRKKKEVNPLEKKVEQLEKEKAKLEKKLRQAEKIIEFQKKIAELLEAE